MEWALEFFGDSESVEPLMVAQQRWGYARVEGSEVCAAEAAKLLYFKKTQAAAEPSSPPMFDIGVRGAGLAELGLRRSRGGQPWAVTVGPWLGHEAAKVGPPLAPAARTAGYADGNGNRTSEKRMVNGVPQVTTFSYDNSGHLLTTTRADGSVVGTLYNEIGKPDTTTDALGRQTRYTYDNNGRLERTDYPDTTYEKTEYDEEGHRTSFRDRGGQVMTYDYDNTGRLTKTHYNDGSFTETAYDPSGLVQTEYDTNRNATTYGYDPSGRRTRVTDALGHSTTYGYDSSGNQTSVTDANGHTTRYSYDEMNRQTLVTFQDSTYTKTTYDSLGRKASVQDQAGLVTSYGYDSMGRLTSVTDPLTNVTHYTYDEAGNELTQVDANGPLHTTTYTYDSLNRRTSRTLPDGRRETYDNYDAVGNLTHKTTFKGDGITYSYDPQTSRLTGMTAPDLSISYGYDALGNRTSMSKTENGVTSSNTYHYDPLTKRLTEKDSPVGNVYYGYDAAGNLTSLHTSYGNGPSLTFVPDELNRRAQVVSGPLITIYHWDNAGSPTSVQLPNGQTVTNGYDTLNRLTSTGSASYGYTYTLGATGNKTAASEQSGRAVAWGYDPLYRVTQESITGAPVSGITNFTYDNSNRLTRDSTVTGVSAFNTTYDSDDHRADQGYDANGSTTSTGGHTYKYDALGQMTGVDVGTANEIDLVYDGDGILASRTAHGVTTQFLTDGGVLNGYPQVLAEVVNGSPVRVYNYGLSRISVTDVASGATRYFGTDGSGSTRVLTDENGNVTDTFTYGVDGLPLGRTGTTVCPFGFQGEYTDPDTGLIYLRARWMNPQTGEFMTMDSFEGDNEVPVTLHKYSFVRWDGGVNMGDPSGNDASAIDSAYGIPSAFERELFATLRQGGVPETGVGLGEAWKHQSTKMKWSNSDISDFRQWIGQNYFKYDNDALDCADLSITMLVDFAATHGLPVSLKTDGGLLLRSARTAYKAQAYVDAARRNISTAGLVKNNTQRLGDLPGALSMAQTGDLMQHTDPLNNLYTGHTMVFLDKSLTFIHYIAGDYTTATGASGPVKEHRQQWWYLNVTHHPKYLNFWSEGVTKK